MNWLPIAFRLVRLWPDILRLYEMIRPALAEIQRVAPDAVPLAKQLLNEVAPELVASFTAGTTRKYDVRWLQESLNKHGEKLAVDGIMGEATHDAVRRFQAKAGITVDGWAGIETCAKLNEG